MTSLLHKSAPADPAAAPPGGTAGDTPKAAGPTILIVDDSATESHIFAAILVKEGYRVEIAADGEQGLAMARRLKPDLVLMDVIMPVLNGFQATRMLHHDPATAQIPVIIVTTKDQPTDRTWGLRQGALDYLVKPVSAEQLLACVRGALGR